MPPAGRRTRAGRWHRRGRSHRAARATESTPRPSRAARCCRRGPPPCRRRESRRSRGRDTVRAMQARILDGDKLVTTTDPAEIRAALAADRRIWIDLERQTPDAERLLAQVLGLP